MWKYCNLLQISKHYFTVRSTAISQYVRLQVINVTIHYYQEEILYGKDDEAL